MTNRVLEIEQLSFRALPALEQHHYDGWTLRLSGGYTGRANSVNPLYPSTHDLDEKIAYCEAFYAKHHLPSLFKLTDAHPDDLDRRLAQAGYNYRENGFTHVLTADLTQHNTPISPDLGIGSSLTLEWFQPFAQMNAVSADNQTLLGQMLGLIQPRCAYALLKQDDQPVGVALGVLDGSWLGIYDVVVSGEHRRKGHGQALVSGVMAWGKQNGATDAYLQVVRDNIPALNLYQGLGFAHTYDYWYRVKR